MYKMLSGKYPFTSNKTKHQILNQAPEPITSIRPDIPNELVDITNKAMAKADEDRFQTAVEFAREVERIFNLLYPQSELLNSSGKYMNI